MCNYTLKKKVLFFLIPITISVSLGLVLGEIYVRLFSQEGYITPEILKNRSLPFVPSLFSRHVFPRKEKTAYGWDNAKYYINEKGYRGHNFTVTKPRGTLRIIFYGGSAVFDSPQTKDWPHRVEGILRQNGFPEVEVINAGISGHASFDSVGRLFSEGHIFSPDYVILYNAWNDIKYFRSKEPLIRLFRPFVQSSNPFLNYQGALDRFLCEHSQLYVRLRYGYFNRTLRVGAEGVKQAGEEYSSEISELGLRQYRLNVEMFVDLARNIGAVPILFTQARLVTRSNTESQKARIVYDYQFLTHHALCKAFEKTDEIIYRVAKAKNVLVIDASKHLTGEDDLFRDHVHLTDRGAEELARLTAQEMAELLKERASKEERGDK